MTTPAVEIVGAGPVGLLAALAAHASGLRPIVYERRLTARPGSRSIGIHPPSIELLERLGLAERFLDRGVRVDRGIAIGTSGVLGAIDFGRCFGRHRYVLALPQADTERVLREALEERTPASVVAGHDFRPECGASRDAIALIACDGKYSRVREAAGIEFDGGAYEGLYAMADFPDETALGRTAAVFLGRGGLVESFPLPGNRRRWVVRRSDRTAGQPDATELADVVRAQTGYRLSAGDAADLTSFKAERYIASTFAHGRTALAGDAAHIVSPIGGQGMNLGWLGVGDLMSELGQAVRAARSPVDALRRNARKRMRMARAAARRAEINMWLGRPTEKPEGRDRVVAALLRQPMQALLASVFTMRGIATGV